MKNNIMSLMLAAVVLQSCSEHQVFVPVEGIPGKDAKGCVVTKVLNGVLVQCGDSEVVFIADGKDGKDGVDGSDGVDGKDGRDGADGSDGVDAFPVTVVKFCPNSVPTYPSVFPEVGLVIYGKIYAVYSTKGGFLTELPPGNYYSNAVGSACSFKVTSTATIEPL